MKLLQHLLSSVRVLEVVLTSDSHTIAAWRCRAGRTAEQTAYDPAAVAKEVVLVTVTGHGTLSKPAASELAARVRSDEETFLWNDHDDLISFVRRERVQSVLEELAAANIHPQRISVAVTPDAAAQTFFATLRWRSLLHPTVEASALMQCIARRLALPVLGIFLCLLVVNAVVSPSLGRRCQSLQTELAARERSASAQADVTARQQTLAAEFAATAPTSRALLCDRIAAAVPQKIVLTQLSVEPLTKRFEAAKPLQRKEHFAVVNGMAATADDISDFVERLSTERCFRAVHLANVERERDGDRLHFRIEMTL